jgi:hypothetical protein
VKIFKQKYFVCHKFCWKSLTKFLYQNESSSFEFQIQNNLNQSPKLNFPFNLAGWAKPLDKSFPSLHSAAWAEWTLDWVTDLGKYSPKSTIPDVVFDTMPIRAIGESMQSRGCGRRLQLKNPGLGGVTRLGIAVKERDELG